MHEDFSLTPHSDDCNHAVCISRHQWTVPAGSLSRGGDVTVYVWHKSTEPAQSFLFCSCVFFCPYSPFNCISFHKFSRQISVFWLCSSGLISALLVLSTISLFMKVSFSPGIILSGWLGSKHQLTNYQWTCAITRFEGCVRSFALLPALAC